MSFALVSSPKVSASRNCSVKMSFCFFNCPIHLLQNEPGTFDATSHLKPSISVLVIQNFMAKPEFTFVSQQVRASFVALKQQYMSFKGGQYPQQMPYPEDTAIMAQQAQQMMAAQGGMPAGPVGPQ